MRTRGSETQELAKQEHSGTQNKHNRTVCLALQEPHGQSARTRSTCRCRCEASRIERRPRAALTQADEYQPTRSWQPSRALLCGLRRLQTPRRRRRGLAQPFRGDLRPPVNCTNCTGTDPRLSRSFCLLHSSPACQVLLLVLVVAFDGMVLRVRRGLHVLPGTAPDGSRAAARAALRYYLRPCPDCAHTSAAAQRDSNPFNKSFMRSFRSVCLHDLRAVQTCPGRRIANAPRALAAPSCLSRLLLPALWSYCISLSPAQSGASAHDDQTRRLDQVSPCCAAVHEKINAFARPTDTLLCIYRALSTGGRLCGGALLSHARTPHLVAALTPGGSPLPQDQLTATKRPLEHTLPATNE